MMLKVHNVTSTDGTRLHVEERGPIDAPPILMLHGFGQCALSWKHQFGGSLEQRYRLITPDLRGHGRSDKPRAPGAYTDGRLWAGDVGAILNQLELVSPILLAWSYSGLAACDFLRHDDQSKLGGLGLVSARSKIGTATADAMAGHLFHDLLPGFLAEDAETRIAGIEAFLKSLTHHDIPADDYYEMVGYNAVMPAYVCRALLERSLDNDDVLANVNIPTWIVHGDKDPSLLISLAEHHAGLIPHARLSIYRDVGHAPFLEQMERFNNELHAFAKQCHHRANHVHEIA
jgi:non-heme chloroperoxidase